MIPIKTAITICVIHILYYAYIHVWDEIKKIGVVHNTPNNTITKLRTKYKVNIRTFQKNSNHYGFAWFKSIYINENLFKSKKALMYTFHHEHWHLKRHHKAKILIARFFFSLIPMLLIFDYRELFIQYEDIQDILGWTLWTVMVAIYFTTAYLLHEMREYFERKAHYHARKMTK